MCSSWINKLKQKDKNERLFTEVPSEVKQASNIFKMDKQIPLAVNLALLDKNIKLINSASHNANAAKYKNFKIR